MKDPFQELAASEKPKREKLKFVPDKQTCIAQPCKNLKDKASKAAAPYDFQEKSSLLKNSYDDLFAREVGLCVCNDDHCRCKRLEHVAPISTMQLMMEAP